MRSVRPNRRLFVHLSFRTIHAQWRMLLNHEWILRDSKDRIKITQEPSYDFTKNIQTCLILHGAGGSLFDSRATAFRILERAPSYHHYQCLVVDIRGHGGSDIDDYEEPHNIHNACNDVMEVLQCFGLSPHVVVASGGILSNLIALCYLEHTMIGSGAPSSISFESSGLNAITPPSSTVLLGGYGSVQPTTVSQLYSNLLHITSKIDMLAASPHFKTVANRLSLRNILIQLKSSKQNSTAASALLEGIIPNYGVMTLEEKAKLCLGVESEENLMLIPDMSTVLTLLTSSFMDFNKIENLGKRLARDHSQRVYIINGQSDQCCVLENSGLDRREWDSSIVAIFVG